MKHLFLFYFLPCLVACQTQLTELEQLFFSKNYGGAIKLAQHEIIDNPQSPAAASFLGQSLIRIGKHVEGKNILLKAVELNKDELPRLAWIYLSLSIAYYSLTEKDSSIYYLNKCLNLGKVSNAYKAAQLFSKTTGIDGQFSDWEIISSDNISFYFPPNSNVENKEQYVNRREYAFKKINSYFNSAIPQKVNFYVWNTIEDGQKYGFPILGFAVPEMCIIHSHSNQTPGHELTHIITFYAALNLNKTRFVNEGLAAAFDQSSEDKLSTSKMIKSNTGFKDYISIEKAWKNPKAYPEWVYYKLSGCFFQKLAAESKPEQIIDLIKNQSFNNSKIIFGEILTQLIKEVEASIN